MSRSLIVCSLLIGIYLPTSVSGERSSSLVLMGYGISLLIACLLPSRPISRLILLLSVPLLLLFTFTSGLPGYWFGAIVPYVVMGVLFSAEIPRIENLERIFIVASVLLLCLCLGIILEVESINSFISANYAMYYDELVPAMVGLHKPVATFASHSIAGLFLYLFFWLNLKSYRAGKRKHFLVLAILFLVCIVALASVTGAVMACIGLIQLAWELPLRRIAPYAAIGAVACTLVVTLWSPHLGEVRAAFDAANTAATTLATSDNGGFIARWGHDGVLAPNLEYIRLHPFSPIGVSFIPDSNFNFIDSGILEHFIRGSLPLFLLVYGGLWYFLSHNLNRSDAMFLFFLLISFEVGFSGLTYFRTLMLLPFIVAYLKPFSLSEQQTADRTQLCGSLQHRAFPLS